MTRLRVFTLILIIHYVTSLNLNYLDPRKLQTVVPPDQQAKSANQIIQHFVTNLNITAEVDHELFKNSKDAFTLKTESGKLRIKASTGVAALWGFNYFLKKYCKGQIAWHDVINVQIPKILPNIEETVEANDRFRYYQNVCTASYSFVWWNTYDWVKHVYWMALNGINLVLAPIAQESMWMEIYKEVGMTDEEIEDHFTGPAFLSWLRMGNVRGWGGPLSPRWHRYQESIQMSVLEHMIKLGMVPVLPAFNGHVPKTFRRIFPNATFLTVDTWNNFEDQNCCGLFIDPSDPLFKEIGKRFLKKVIRGWNIPISHVYTVDPFNEVKIKPWSLELVQKTSEAIFSTLTEVDDKAVWLVQNWMFVHDPVLWPISHVESFLTSVPNGRMLVLDLQSEQWPQYDLYKMYYGQPFIWCMLHNFGGTLGMFGNMKTINKDIYEVRARPNSSMIGIGLTPEGINQNYVVYDLMLESAWRPGPVDDLEKWVADYAERRYGSNSTATAWKYLLKSVYSFEGLNKMRGKYVITRRPSFSIRPWAWYKSQDLFNAFKHFVRVGNSGIDSANFRYDLVDVTRQALQYRAEQLYMNVVKNRMSSTWVFKKSVERYLECMSDIELILYQDRRYSFEYWFSNGRILCDDTTFDNYICELNARNQITLWGPRGEISDYAGKQWAEMFHYYYIPRWRTFLDAAVDAHAAKEVFDEKRVQMAVRVVEENFATVNISYRPQNFTGNIPALALALFRKWGYVSGLEDLPLSIMKKDTKITYPDA